jgi:hypothetical protein
MNAIALAYLAGQKAYEESRGQEPFEVAMARVRAGVPASRALDFAFATGWHAAAHTPSTEKLQ